MTLDAGFDGAKMENLKIRGLPPLTLAILNYIFNFKVWKSTSQIIRITVINTTRHDLKQTMLYLEVGQLAICCVASK